VRETSRVPVSNPGNAGGLSRAKPAGGGGGSGYRGYMCASAGFGEGIRRSFVSNLRKRKKASRHQFFIFIFIFLNRTLSLMGGLLRAF